MSSFWTLWAAVGTVVFFALMVAVIVKYWRNNHQADKDKVLDTFDGIEEKDAPPPKILFVSYFAAFVISVGYLILYPGISGWSGLLNYDQADDKLSTPTTSLDEQFSQLQDQSLMLWRTTLR